jgi:hypothetical protein
MNTQRKPPCTKPPRVTASKGIRLTEAELEHVGKLLPQYPECASEAELLRQATLIGLYVLAAQARGQPAYGGYRPHELLALLKYRLLGAIDFLFEHDAFPAPYCLRSASNAAETSTAEAGSSGIQIVTDAADELGDLGTGFIDEQ